MLGIFFIILFGIIAARFIFGGPEDTWICEKGQWIMHGKPSVQKPVTPCIIKE